MKIYHLVLCLIGSMLASCMDSGANPMTPFVNVPYTVVAQGIQHNIKNQQLHVVTDATQLAALTAAAAFSPALPPLDLGANNLVAIFLPPGTACDGLGIVNVSENADVLLFEVEKTVPGDNIVCAALVVNHALSVLATIPKSGKPVSLSFTIRKIGSFP